MLNRVRRSASLISLSGLVAAGFVASVIVTSPIASATAIGDARAQAAALNASISQLQNNR